MRFLRHLRFIVLADITFDSCVVVLATTNVQYHNRRTVYRNHASSVDIRSAER